MFRINYAKNSIWWPISCIYFFYNNLSLYNVVVYYAIFKYYTFFSLMHSLHANIFFDCVTNNRISFYVEFLVIIDYYGMSFLDKNLIDHVPNRQIKGFSYSLLIKNGKNIFRLMISFDTPLTHTYFRHIQYSDGHVEEGFS